MERAVLWDMDGTLVDSLPHHWVAWKAMAESVGFAVSYDLFLATLGRFNDEILVSWFGDRFSPEERAELGLEKEVIYRNLIREKGIEALPGVVDWITRLKAEGWKQAVATAGPRLNEEAVVDTLGLGPLFDARITGDDAKRGKPFPDVFLAAAQRLGIAPERAIVVEDAIAGVQAARAAGMKVIAVCPDGPLDGADVWVKSLTDLPADTFDRLLNEPRT
jgi:beta-phosphoglucomutase